MNHTIGLFILTLGLCSLDTVQAEPDTGQLVQHIFIGQAYPSGNVYLRRFSNEPMQPQDWPDTLTLLPIAKHNSLPRTFTARRVKVLQEKIVDNIVKSIYIPGHEGMDANHNYCGQGKPPGRNPAYQQLSGDFYTSIIDHCESNRGIAVYRITPSTYSFMVLGTDNQISLTDPALPQGEKRPMTPAETRKLAADKEAVRKETEKYECNTIPGWPDSAELIFRARITRPALSLRLSNYLDPGCGGHLSSIYVLDLLQNHKLLDSTVIDQYQGGL
ncbi:MAG: hypothetical protein OEZ39_18815 [Gammaproteobacteria bacterium]|nr:hypothetical protein [Gammaproteobacteria bacterium]MDH5653917.1 hypothetical protein [Gammaproteobacteria bacterium]